MNASLWRDHPKTRSFPPLAGRRTADVAVIGGGMAGILCARRLTEAGADVVLLEAETIGGGITGNTTGKITAQHDVLYAELIKRCGRELAGQYARANLGAIEAYAEMSQGIDCDFVRGDAYVYALCDTTAQDLAAELTAAQSLGIPAALTTDTELPFPVDAALRFPNQARFHPLKFLYGVAEGLDIHEHTRALTVEDKRIATPDGEVQADSVLFCTHYPFINTPGWYFLRVHQSRSYALALRGAANLHGMYVDGAPTGLSFRQQGETLILGGGGHNTGEGTGDNYARLEETARSLYPGAEITHRWSAQDGVTLDEVPYIGRYSADAPNWYVAAGFRKWGMTQSMVAAQILGDLVQGRENPNGAVFDPGRFERTPRFGNLAQEAKAALEGYIGNRAAGHPACTHLGCGLSYNADEDSWDCPCHGSRFTREGALLDGPAQRPLDYPPEIRPRLP